MDNEDLRLFSTKELYRMAHDAKGNSTLFKSVPIIKRRKVMDDNMHLITGMTFKNTRLNLVTRVKTIFFTSFLTTIDSEMPYGIILSAQRMQFRLTIMC